MSSMFCGSGFQHKLQWNCKALTSGNYSTLIGKSAGSAITTGHRNIAVGIIEGLENKNWVLMDYIDVIVHIFKKEFRETYQLEKLWGDADLINIK